MVGLGETDEEILAVMRDLRAHEVDMLTIGQYLLTLAAHPSPVERYSRARVVRSFQEKRRRWAFGTSRSARVVRSSYHADQQAHQAGVSELIPRVVRTTIYGRTSPIILA